MRYDRDELLARTDLSALADELLGFHVGNGRNARWPSPVPNHPQTGRTPPMSIFVDHRGIERWTCFATGANGTAIDLVMVATDRSVGDAMTWLAERARLDRPRPEHTPPVRRPPPPAIAREPSAALKEYVEACERTLWQPEGEQVRRWLIEERCLNPDVLRINRIGADPGPAIFRRAKGLPRHGPAAIFPALDDDRRAVYLQARYLDPPQERGKYDNPTGQHGGNPRLTFLDAAAACDRTTIVTEGVPDALAVASIGFRAAAILGSGLPNRPIAARLALREGALIVAFDADPAGRSGAERLADHLRECGRSDVIAIEPPTADLNGWLVERGDATMKRQIGLAIRLASSGRAITGAGRSIASRSCS